MYIHVNTISEDDEIMIGLGTSGKNGTEQTIATINTEPTGVEWFDAPTFNEGIFFGTLDPGDERAFWIWRHLNSTSQPAKNKADLIIAFDPPSGSTGTGSGSGTGIPIGGGGGAGGSPTPVPAPSVNDFNIAVVGDFSESSDAEETVDNIVSFEDLDEVTWTIGLGDYSYEDDGETWAEITEPLREDGKDMDGGFGNHERTEGTPQPELTDFYLDLFGIDNDGHAYHDKLIENVYIVFIDCYSSFGVGSTQYNWIKQKMESSKNNSAITWRILYAHEPMYASPNHYSGVSGLRNAYHPLMMDNGFDFFFCGHNHNYERMYPLAYNSGSPSNPTLVDDSQDPDYSSPGAPIFLQVGTGGRDSHQGFDGQSAFSAKQVGNTFGFLMLSITNSGRQITGKFYRNGDASQLDIFTVIK